MRPMRFSPRLLALAVSAAIVNTAAASGPTLSLAQVQAQAEGYTALPKKKMGSGVEIFYRLEGTPAPGKAVSLHLTISSRTLAQVKLRGGEGLVVSSAETTLLSTAGEISQHRVEVTPQMNGRLYLYLESTANGRGNASAIAIQVGKGEAQRKPSGKLQSMPDGERVISVPAR